MRKEGGKSKGRDEESRGNERRGEREEGGVCEGKVGRGMAELCICESGVASVKGDIPREGKGREMLTGEGEGEGEEEGWGKGRCEGVYRLTGDKCFFGGFTEVAVVQRRRGGAGG